MKKIVVGVILLIVTLAAIFGIGYLSSYSSLGLEFDQSSKGLTVDVLEYVENEHEGDPKGKMVAQSISSNKTLRLKKRSYIVVSQPSEQFAEFNEVVNLSKGNKTIHIKASLSDNELKKDLGSSANTVQQALTDKFPNLNSLYTISEGRLHEQGQWYTTLLVSKSKDILNNDTLRVVLKKNDNQWAVVTVPPEITVSTVKYPDIPRAVADAVNKEGLK